VTAGEALPAASEPEPGVKDAIGSTAEPSSALTYAANKREYMRQTKAAMMLWRRFQ